MMRVVAEAMKVPYVEKGAHIMLEVLQDAHWCPATNLIDALSVARHFGIIVSFGEKTDTVTVERSVGEELGCIWYDQRQVDEVEGVNRNDILCSAVVELAHSSIIKNGHN